MGLLTVLVKMEETVDPLEEMQATLLEVEKEVRIQGSNKLSCISQYRDTGAGLKILGTLIYIGSSMLCCRRDRSLE